MKLYVLLILLLRSPIYADVCVRSTPPAAIADSALSRKRRAAPHNRFGLGGRPVILRLSMKPRSSVSGARPPLTRLHDDADGRLLVLADAPAGS